MANALDRLIEGLGEKNAANLAQSANNLVLQGQQLSDLFARPAQAPIQQTPDPPQPSQARPQPQQPPQGPSPEVQQQSAQLLEALLARGSPGTRLSPGGFLGRLGFTPSFAGGQPLPGLGGMLAQHFENTMLQPARQQIAPELLNIPEISALFQPQSFVGPRLLRNQIQPSSTTPLNDEVARAAISVLEALLAR